MNIKIKIAIVGAVFEGINLIVNAKSIISAFLSDTVNRITTLSNVAFYFFLIVISTIITIWIWKKVTKEERTTETNDVTREQPVIINNHSTTSDVLEEYERQNEIEDAPPLFNERAITLPPIREEYGSVDINYNRGNILGISEQPRHIINELDHIQESIRNGSLLGSDSVELDFSLLQKLNEEIKQKDIQHEEELQKAKDKIKLKEMNLEVELRKAKATKLNHHGLDLVKDNATMKEIQLLKHEMDRLNGDVESIVNRGYSISPGDKTTDIDFDRYIDDKLNKYHELENTVKDLEVRLAVSESKAAMQDYTPPYNSGNHFTVGSYAEDDFSSSRSSSSMGSYRGCSATNMYVCME